MRKDSTEIPSHKELQDILAREAKRELSLEKHFIHFPNFTTITDLFSVYDMPTDLLNTPVSEAEMKAYIARGIAEIQALTEHIISREPNTAQREALDRAYDYLTEEDAPERSDLIFVFGSKALFRIDKAIELFKAGYAPLILISGRQPSYHQGEEIEAEILKTHAIAQGVPEAAILTETKSITLPDNVKSSLNLLDEQDIPYRKVVLVNSPYAQRRGWAHFQKFSLDGTQLVRINSLGTGRFDRDQWYKEKDTASTVLNEFAKMKISLLLNTA